MRTYSQATWVDARSSWERSSWGEEWRELRRLAARAGVIYAPHGSTVDSIADAKPSQRAILEHAMSTSPELLRRAILEARHDPGWGRVIERLLELLPKRTERPRRGASSLVAAGDVLAHLATQLRIGGAS
jgi:hypothetical protein